MKFNLTVKALRDLRTQLGISQGAVSKNLRIPHSTFRQYEIEQYPMPEKIHTAYEKFLFEVLNGEKVITCRKNQVKTLAQKQSEGNDDSELLKARVLIKEYEALLDMYRKELANHGI